MVWIRVLVAAMTYKKIKIKILKNMFFILFYFLPSSEARGCTTAHPHVQIGYYKAPTYENKPRKINCQKFTSRMF